MKIQVLINYGGVDTNGQRILPGVYDVNDAALFGVWRGLLERKQAIIVEHDADPDAETEPVATINKMVTPMPVAENTEQPEVPLMIPTSVNTKAEIMDFMVDFNIAFEDSMTKAELLQLIADANLS